MGIFKLPTTPASSFLMSRIRSKNTKPELIVRTLLHSLGFRYRLHVRALPGTPDIVLPKFRTIIQVQGCFWHAHSCLDGRTPRVNAEYWHEKLMQNRERDRTNNRKLRRLGWSVHILWECQLNTMSDTALRDRLLRILPPGTSHASCSPSQKCRAKKNSHSS